MAVTRCQENTGFLVLHRCENPAEFNCVYCGRRICHEHGQPVDAPAQAPAPPPPPPNASGVMTPPPPPPPPPGLTQAYACLTCLRNRQQQGQQQAQRQGIASDYDPYYTYPYYGSYHPYQSHYYYDYGDRGVFDRGREQADTSERADALGS